MKEVKYKQGDLVKRILDQDNLIWKVKDVCQNIRGEIIYKLIAGREEDAAYSYEDQISGITLTPQILEANGWKKNEYGVYYKNFNPHKAICLAKEDGNNWEISTGGATLVHCKFVHQLQHLLFGLGLDSSLKV